MSSQPIKNQAYTFYLSLVSQSTGQFQASPTLAAGDVKVLIDDGAPANITTLPVVDADYTRRVKVSLSASEMNGDKVNVYFVDAAGAEWDEAYVHIDTISWLDANDDITGLANDTVTAAALASDAVTEIQSGLSTLTAAGVRSAVGLASANLDTQLSGIQADTDNIQTRLPAALSGDGFMKADLLSIGDELVSGNNATLKIKQLEIINSSGKGMIVRSSTDHAAEFTSSGGGGNGLALSGNGGGAGLYTTGGSTGGAGFEIAGGLGGGIGLLAYSSDNNASAVGLYGNGTGKSIDAPNDIAVSDGSLTLAAIRDTVWTKTIETGYNALQSMRLMLSALAGKLSGAATTTVTIRNAADSKNRIVATVDSSGNRTAVTHDVSD